MNRPMNKPYPEIYILSQDEATEKVRNNPDFFNVISLWSGGGGKHGKEQPQFKDAALSVCQHRFHDITEPEEGRILCNEDHIKEILAFGRQNIGSPLIIHCYAGISRSSAICFLLLLQYYKEKDLINCIDISLKELVLIKSHHCIRPNSYIIILGIMMMSKDIDETNRWMEELNSHEIWKLLK